MDRYEKALELARAYYDKDANAFLDTIFPELKESKDEKARKWLTNLVENLGDAADEDAEKELEVMRPLALAYLEKQAEWSEEDEKKINFLSRLIEFQVKDDEYCFGNGRLISKQEAIEMLKSLRPSWRPSEEQMKEYSYWYRNFIESGLASPTSKAVTVLGELLEQLKKLI